MTRADKDALAGNLRQEVAAVAAKDQATFYALDVAFHQILTAGLGMARASDVLESLRVHLERTRRLTMSTSAQLRASLNEHAAIAAAIEAEDPAAARDAMKQHLDYNRRAARNSRKATAGTFLPLRQPSTQKTTIMATPRALRLDPSDNVIIAIDDIAAGSEPAEASALASAFRRATRWRWSPVAEGAPIRKFGQIIGFASKPIAAGRLGARAQLRNQGIRARLSFWRGHAPREHPAR